MKKLNMPKIAMLKNKISYIAASFLVGISIASFSMDALCATSNAFDFPIQGKLVRQATVIYMPDRIEMLHSFDEKNLIAIGCTYVTQDRGHINQLIGVLRDFDMELKPEAETIPVNLFQGVYLDFSDGTSQKYLFSRVASGALVNGIVSSSDASQVKFFTSKPVEQSLRRWSLAVGKNSNHDSLDILRANCDPR